MYSRLFSQAFGCSRGERGGNTEGLTYGKDREICHYSNREPESVQLHSMMLQKGSHLWHDTSVCGLILVIFSLSVSSLAYATSILVSKINVEAKDAWLSQSCFQKAKR